MESNHRSAYRAGTPYWVSVCCEYAVKPFRDLHALDRDRGEFHGDGDPHPDGNRRSADLLPRRGGHAGGSVRGAVDLPEPRDIDPVS